MPDVEGDDFKLIQASGEIDAAQKIVQIANKLYDKRINFQVLSPRHGGDAGVTSLNSVLRTSLNPSIRGLHEVRFGSALMREGDRIMITKNDYNKGVYNGDVGKVSFIDKKAKEIEIKIHEGVGLPPSIVRYEFKDASNSLRLAYAQTVHKSQGQEYDVIVIPVLDSFGFQLQRNLFYTAITRAKKKVFLIGTSSAINRAVSNDRASHRKTLLSARIIGFLSNQ
jgi:exodeoxyribonuclease V alpha subunit